MAFASITYTSASGTTFALTNSDGNAIDYLRQSDIAVTVNGAAQSLTTDYTFNAAGTSIVLNTAVTNATVVITRTTSIVNATVDFTAGSTLTADDLNNSDKQNRFALQEFSDTYGALTTGSGDLSALAGFIGSAETWASDNAHAATTGAIDARIDSKTATKLTDDIVAGNAITVSDNTPSSGKVTVAVTNAAIDSAELAAGAVTSAKIADANVTTAKINNAAVTTAKIADANVTSAKLANDSVTSAKIADGTIVAGDIAANAVTSAKILAANVTTAKIADDAVTNAKIADNAITQPLMADDSVGTNEIIDGNVTNVKLADAELKELATMSTATAQALADLTGPEVQILDGATLSTAELNLLDGVTATTAELNVTDGITATTTELNQLDGNTLTNSPTWSSTTQYPSAASVNSRFVGLMDSLGGFVAIANETSFPTTNPDPSDNAGTVVSIADAGGLTINASGVATNAATTGGTSVTINGFPSSLQSTTLTSGLGLQVQTTTTLNTYTYHKLIAKEADVISLSQDIEDFSNRYRVSSSDPTTDNDEGDLVFNTTSNDLKVYNGSAWVAAAAATAAEVSSSAAGNISATNVQAALQELDTEKLALSGGTMTGNITFNSGQTIDGYTPRTGATGSANLPVGTTAQRDGTPAAGMIRYNSTLGAFEGYSTSWGEIGGGGGATGGGSDEWALEHDNTITTSYTIGTGKNVISAGPLTVNSGAVITVPSGSNWTIV